jgi:chromosome segregation ATPase
MESDSESSGSDHSGVRVEEPRNASQLSTAILVHDLERMASQLRDQETRLQAQAEEIKQLRHGQGRINLVDEALRDVRGHILAIGDRLSQQEKASEHQQLLRGTEVDRNKKHIGTVSDALAEVRGQIESAAARIQGLNEQQRQDRALIAPIPDQLAELDRRVATGLQRFQPIDEANRRQDVVLSSLQQSLELLGTRLSTIESGQKLAEIRLNRQVAEWQGQFAREKESGTDVTKLITQLGLQINQIRNDMQTRQEALTQVQRRFDDSLGEAQRLGNLISAGRDHVIRVENLIENQRRRLDETNAGVARLDDIVSQRVADLIEQSARLDSQWAAIVANQNHLGQIEQECRRALDEVAGLRTALGNQARTWAEQQVVLGERLEAEARRQDVKLLEMTSLMIEHRRRQKEVVDLEMSELSERARQAERGHQVSPSSPDERLR